MKYSLTVLRRVALLSIALLVVCGVTVESRAKNTPVQRKRVVRKHHAQSSTRRRRRRTRALAAAQSKQVTTPRAGIVYGTRDVDAAPATTTNSGIPAAVSPTPAVGREKSPGHLMPINGGVLNGKAISKPQPVYPPIAKAARAQGTVVVQIVIDEKGDVISASAVSGHPLLQQAAVQAARQAKFTPTLLSGQPVKVAGVITYNFVLLDDTRPKA